MLSGTIGDVSNTPAIDKDYYVMSDEEGYVTFSSSKPFNITVTGGNRSKLLYSTNRTDWQSYPLFSPMQTSEIEFESGKYCIFVKATDSTYVTGESGK